MPGSEGSKTTRWLWATPSKGEPLDAVLPQYGAGLCASVRGAIMLAPSRASKVPAQCNGAGAMPHTEGLVGSANLGVGNDPVNRQEWPYRAACRPVAPGS